VGNNKPNTPVDQCPATNKNEKRSETQTLRGRCSKAKKFLPCRRPPSRGRGTAKI